MRSSALALIVVAIALTAPAENSSPSVSPDGKRIAFISDRDGTTDIYVMAADGSQVVRITNTAEKEWPVQWSSDGSVLFGVADKDSSRLFEAKKTVTQIGTVPGRAGGSPMTAGACCTPSGRGPKCN
jgi:dipeptidyl aminopeptidase/acylaminoacyl peptidase